MWHEARPGVPWLCDRCAHPIERPADARWTERDGPWGRTWVATHPGNCPLSVTLHT